MQDKQGRKDEGMSIPDSSLISVWGAARPLAVVAGALVALQSSQSLDISKVAFLAVAILALAGSVMHAWRARDSALVEAARPWLICSAIIGALVALSLPVAVVNGTPVTTWVRDAASYVLFAASPWLALDLGASVSPRAATYATVVAGSLATASFTVNWLQRRNIVDLPIDRLVLPSLTLSAGLFALFVALAIWSGRDRYAWSILSAVAIGLLLATGTRTILALAAIPIVLLADAVRSVGPRILRTSMLSAFVPLLWVVIVVAPGVLDSLPSPSPSIPIATATAGLTPGTSGVPSSSTPAEPSAARPSPALPTPAPISSPAPSPTDDGRFGTIDDVISGTDASLRLRWAQTISAWNIFISSPLVGRGLGVSIPWIDVDGSLINYYFADTPITVLAKFGIFGVAIWVAVGWATIATLRQLREVGSPGSIARSALLGFATALVVLSPFGAQLEDKGTALGLILLLGLAFAVIRPTGLSRRGGSA